MSEDQLCADHPTLRVITRPAASYPQGQESMLGEGWVELAHTITPSGDVTNIRLIDLVGAPVFAHQASGALSKAKFAPVTVSGKPVSWNARYTFRYLIEGKNRAGVHAKVSGSYDAAAAARKFGAYDRSLRILLETNKLTLNLYEYALTSYGLAMSYLGLGDRRRALLHMRHAAIGDGDFVDTGLIRSTLAILAELEARDGNPRAALCVLATLKKKRPDYAPAAQLLEMIAAARAALDGGAPVRNEVEIIESGRDEMILPRWSHPVLRRTLQFTALQGAVKNYRITCPTHVLEGVVFGSGAIDVDQTIGSCALEVYGDPGAKFVLDEK
jgi:TonB family protein